MFNLSTNNPNKTKKARTMNRTAMEKRKKRKINTRNSLNPTKTDADICATHAV